MQFACISHKIPFTGVDNIGKAIIRAFKFRVVIIGEYHVLCPRVIAIISLILHFILDIYFIFVTFHAKTCYNGFPFSNGIPFRTRLKAV